MMITLPTYEPFNESNGHKRLFFTFRLFSMNGESFVSPWKQEDYVGTAFCGSLAITFYVLTSLHFTALFALSLDRMVAIHLPFKYRRIANSYYM